MPAPLAILAASGHELPLLTTLAAGFVAAWILGLITQRLGLSPIVGYLLAGVVIGPKTLDSWAIRPSRTSSRSWA